MNRITIKLPHAPDGTAREQHDGSDSSSRPASERAPIVQHAMRGRLVAVEYRRRKTVIACKAEAAR
jgi:hypothetical protein